MACYAVIFPAGIGIVYWVPIMCGWEWFPDRKGLVSGLVVGGYGFGAFIFGYISTAIANPDDLKTAAPEDGSTTDKLFPQHVAEEVPHMFRTCLILWVLLALCGVVLVSGTPAFGQQEYIRQRREKIDKANNKS